jgi:cell wall assembly regulator SMI1
MDPSRRRLLIGGGLLMAAAVGGVAPAACAWWRMKDGSAPEPSPVPKRPAGSPAPALDEDIAPILARLDLWYAAHLPSDRYRFNPPASGTAIEEAERDLGIAMPRAWRQLYRWHDGEEDDRFGHVYGLPILPLDRVVAEWRSWREVLKDLHGNRYAVRGGSWPAGAVDPAYINLRRVPLTSDGSGNHIGLDLDPWPGGRVGQIILYGRDEDMKAVIAPSLGSFLGWVAELLESGNFRLESSPATRRLRDFRLREPATDSFMDGARTLKGAPGPFV